MTPEPLLASFAIRVWITRLGENVALSLDPMLTTIKPNTLKTASTGRAYQLVCFPMIQNSFCCFQMLVRGLDCYVVDYVGFIGLAKLAIGF
ncbi:hypothetical protein D3C81_1855980 [compost metagenome]